MHYIYSGVRQAERSGRTSFMDCRIFYDTNCEKSPMDFIEWT